MIGTKTQSAQVHHHRYRRSGALTVCVLVCMLVAATLVSAATQLALRSRRGVRLRQQMLQTELLLDAGVLRAAQQLQLAADYQGESWRPETSITTFPNAVVEIRVITERQADSKTTLDDGASRTRIDVAASLGIAVEDATHSKASQTTRSHTFTIHTVNSTPESSNAE